MKTIATTAAAFALLGLAACGGNDAAETNTADTNLEMTTEEAIEDTNAAATDAINAADAALEDAGNSIENAAADIDNAADNAAADATDETEVETNGM